MTALRLPPAAFAINGFEYWGQIGFLKAGLFYADRLTTVSPTYGREIQTPTEGMGLEGLLAGRSGVLTGILNGVDQNVWNPTTDPFLGQHYDPDRLPAKLANKLALQRALGLEQNPQRPLFVVVSRLTPQKGLDLVLAELRRIIGRGGQLALLGTGDALLETAFTQIAAAEPRHVAARIAYDEGLAHRLIGGGDVILVPSRSEPCGLTQLYGLRYGTLPLVRRTGGLADSVVDATPASLADGTATGFVFGAATPAALGGAIDRACDLHADTARWRRLQENAMRQDFGWSAAAARYRDLYQTLAP
jgi:starch synthase